MNTGAWHRDPGLGDKGIRVDTEIESPGEDHVQVSNMKSLASTVIGPSHPQNGQWGKVVTVFGL